MAEEDAEIAMLHQMQAGQDNEPWGEDAEEVVENELPEDTENSDEQVKTESIADDQALRAVSPSITGVLVDDGAPTTLTSLPPAVMALAGSQQQSRSSSRASVRKPKTIAGFVDDDSESDSEGNAVPLLHVPATSVTPLPISTPQNGSAAQTPVSNELPGISSENKVQVYSSTMAPNGGPTTALLPKARLPQDIAGILEDRIKQDPRGDIEAWLSLVSEHRKRNKLDDARQVYERFLKVFPTAVGVIPLMYHSRKYTNMTRRKYG